MYIKTTVILLFTSLVLQAQQLDIVDFKTITADITILPKEKKVTGKLSTSFTVLEDTSTVYLDAVAMELMTAKPINKGVGVSIALNKIVFSGHFIKGKTYTVTFAYSASPKKALYFIGWDTEGQNQVWTQGQGKNTSHWLPSIDDMNDKIIFNLTITAPKAYEVIANGLLEETKTVDDSKTWGYTMNKPMSSYLVAMAIGKYSKTTATSASGVPLAFYYYPNDSLKVEPTYRHSIQMFNFLEKEIGIDYPWQNYKQVPVKDFLYGGMENTGTTIFSDRFVVDSTAFIDRNYINTNAHELAHQWFGNLVTEVSASEHWLHEGFASYYALLVEKDIFGEDYFYWKVSESANRLAAMAKANKGEALTNPKASSITFYEKGALALYALHEKIGDTAFKKTIKEYLSTYRYKNVTVTNFISIASRISNTDLKGYTSKWLTNTEFDKQWITGFKGMDSFLESATYITDFHANTFKDIKAKNKAITKLYSDFDKGEPYYTSYDSFFEGFNLENSAQVALYAKAFAIDNPKLRQGLARVIKKEPKLQAVQETLLEDKSYVTLENALYALWQYYPTSRRQYLDKTKGITGFNDKSFRVLWLSLALATENYAGRSTPVYYKELSSYTASKYNYEIRSNAFYFLSMLQMLNNDNLRDLLNASRHHVWQFSKSSRKIVDQLLLDADYKKRLLNLAKDLDVSTQAFLDKRIKAIKNTNKQ